MANGLWITGKVEQFKRDGVTPSYTYVTKEQSQYNTARIVFTIPSVELVGDTAKVSRIRCVATGTVADEIAARVGKMVKVTGKREVRRVGTGDQAKWYDNTIITEVADFVEGDVA